MLQPIKSLELREKYITARFSKKTVQLVQNLSYYYFEMQFSITKE